MAQSYLMTLTTAHHLRKIIGSQAKAQEVNKEIAKYVDVMIGNEEDFTASLGFEVEGNDAELKELNMDGSLQDD